MEAGDVAPLTYVVFQIEDQLVVACDLEGCELLRLPCASEEEASSREFLDLVHATLASLLPHATPLPGTLPSPAAGADAERECRATLAALAEQDAAIARVMAADAEEERAARRALEARDARLARGLQRRERTVGSLAPGPAAPSPPPSRAWAWVDPSAPPALPAQDFPALCAPASPARVPGRPAHPQQCPGGRPHDRTEAPLDCGRDALPQTRAHPAGPRIPALPSLPKADASVREAVLKSAACTSLQPHRQPPSPARLRRMMHATDKEREAHESSEEEPERVSKSSIRKLVADMHARGWHPVRQGHSGHYKYERLIPELGGLRQMHMLAGTPSSRRYIWAVRAAMARADREVAELRARQQGPSLVA
ncbi:hypothetical protein ACKKBG_A22695 [Auxenochlorella protothecoides x Auxenochlorella symbiontica]